MHEKWMLKKATPAPSCLVCAWGRPGAVDALHQRFYSGSNGPRLGSLLLGSIQKLGRVGSS